MDHRTARKLQFILLFIGALVGCVGAWGFNNTIAVLVGLGIMVLSILIDYTHGLLVERYRSRDKLARWFVAESDFESGPAGLFQILGFLCGKPLTSAGNHASGAGTAAAHRHFFFHVPDYELHH